MFWTDLLALVLLYKYAIPLSAHLDTRINYFVVCLLCHFAHPPQLLNTIKAISVTFFVKAFWTHSNKMSVP